MLSAIPPATGRGPLSVLLAEDNEILRAVVGRLLRLMGHDVEVVGGGLEAVEAASRRKFDVVFLDVQMPGMGGPEAAARLREEHGGDCPWIVGLSGDAEGREHHAAFGMDDFVAKPARSQDLRRALERPGGGLPS